MNSLKFEFRQLITKIIQNQTTHFEEISSFEGMKPNLNYWQTALLFLPFVLGVVLAEIPESTAEARQDSFRLVNVFFNFSLCLIVSYQAWLGIKFNTSRPQKATWFNINAMVSVVFVVLYFLFVLFLTFVKPTPVNLSADPIRRVNYHFSGILLLLLFAHSAINFYVTNPLYVAAQIKKVMDADEQKSLTIAFLNPMTWLRKASIIIIGGLILAAAVIDIIRASTSVH